MILVINRQMLFSNREQYIGTTADNNSEIRMFKMNRVNQGGTDLAHLTFKLDLEYSNHEKDTCDLKKENTGDAIFLQWEIPSNALQVPGPIFANIRAADEIGAVKWSSFRGVFYSEEAINTPGAWEGKLSELEEAEKKLEAIKEEAEQIKEEAETAKEEIKTASEMAENAKEEAKTAAEEIKSAKEEVQASAEGVKTAKAEAEAAAGEAKAAATEAGAAAEKAAAAETEAKEAAQMAESAKKEVQAAAETINSAKEEIETIKTEVEAAQTVLKEAKEAAADAEEAITDFTNKTESIIEEVKENSQAAKDAKDAAKIAAGKAEEAARNVPLATNDAAGIVKPDGTTITVNEDGTLSVPEDEHIAQLLENDIALSKKHDTDTTSHRIVSGESITVQDSSENPFRGLRLFGKSIQGESPSLDNPQEIESVGDGGSITVNIDEQPLVITVPNGLPGIPVGVDELANYTDSDGVKWCCDEIDLERGVYVQRIGKIDSYNDENIETDYMSTTGSLDTGATVRYILATPITTPLPEDVLVQYKALHTNYPTTTILNDVSTWMEVDYFTNSSVGEVAGETKDHLNDTENPHKVTAEQTGAAEKDHVHTVSDITDFPSEMTPSSHTQAASTITAGTFSATGVKAATGTDYTTQRIRNIAAQTGSVTAGTTSLANGNVLFQYS